MDYRVLGTTGVKVSPLCLGAMMFGPQGNPDHDDSARIIHRALDGGINFVDTADVYSQGESETIVGKALAGGRRDTVVLATKAHGSMGDDVNQQGNSRRWITQEVENSLRRLGTDHIDLYQIHRPDPTSDIDETLGVLTDLSAPARSATSAPRPSRRTRSWRRNGSRSGVVANGSSASSPRIRCWYAASRPTSSRSPRSTAWASSRGARSPVAG